MVFPDSLQNNIQDLLEDHQVRKLETVQALWSGYGEIARYFSPRLDTNLIVKYVNPPENVTHPRGWNTDTSHQRKLKSYQVEANFYKYYAALCNNDRRNKDFRNNDCRVANLVAMNNKPSCELQVSGTQNLILVLEDLDQSGFAKRYTQVDLAKVKSVIKWLAHFHAKFLANKSKGLWSVGTYWHLDTRKDEHKAMLDGKLKEAAVNISERLNQAQYQTLVHGDAKLANFCFATNQPHLSVAAVDFQYVGQGVGVKDLAYLLGCCLTDDELFKTAPSLLDYYFSQLKGAISEYQMDVDFVQLEHEWRDLYSFAWADFHRFLLGWSPGHFKINGYMQTQTNKAIDKLND
ncbi:oxidoreductase family protein [Paraglaciecola sp.]|uniref:oxidoreductase family protein n=1 Tax=Paraglaciecola sp. TaxID=1920173 RepID=UPI003EF8DD67